MEELNTHFSKIRAVKNLAIKANMSPAVLSLWVLGVGFVLSMNQYTGNFAVMAIGITYPGIMSLAAIRSKSMDDDKQWLTYWVLFAACNFLDYLFGSLVAYIPFYYTFKLGFVVYLFLPVTRGSFIIYEKIIYPKILIKEEAAVFSGSRDFQSRCFKQD